MSLLCIMAAAAAMNLQPLQPMQPGFDVEALAGRSTPPKDLAEARERVVESDMLRALFTLDPARVWDTLSADEAETLHLALGPERGWEPAALAWFMRGAAVRAAGEDLTGLHNPVADVWLLLRWERSGGGLRIVDAALVPGAALRPEAEAASWAEAAGPYALGLAHADALGTARFAELSSTAGSALLFSGLAEGRQAARDQARLTIHQWAAGLAAWSADSERRRAWEVLHGRLIAGGGEAGAAARLPAQVRASLTPAAAIEVQGTPTLLLVSPLYPSLYVIADFPRGLGRPAELNILNLANAEPPAGSGEGGQP